jgi:integrase
MLLLETGETAMSVRKRRWTTSKGVEREAWLVDYTDQNGKRHAKSFAKKKDADAFASKTDVEVRGNVHVADTDSVTVNEAAQDWLARARRELEHGTYVQYRQHVDLHIAPFIGGMKLSKITIPTVRAFMDRLSDEGRSPAMVKAIRTSLGSIISEAQERGKAIRNPVKEMATNRKRAGASSEKRKKKRLEYGVDIPTHWEINQILAHASDRFRPLLMVAVFTGLRSSELRGLRWADVDFDKQLIHVRQRADNYAAIGMPKSEAGQRSIPVGPNVVTTLKEWKLRCPRGELDLVFPNTIGNLESHANLVKRGLHWAQLQCGMTKLKPKLTGVRRPVLQADGSPLIVEAPKYEGLHALRHWFASWCINRKADMGRELPAKVVQSYLGHSTVTLTLDTYGHLFPNKDDDAALREAEDFVLRAVDAT